MTFELGQTVGAFRRRRPQSRGVDWHKATVNRVFQRDTAGRFMVGLDTVCGEAFSLRSDVLDVMQRQPIMLGHHRAPWLRPEPVFVGDRLCPACWA